MTYEFPPLVELKSEPGVYMIRLLLDKRAYVGSSVNVRKRVQNHVSALRRGKHHSDHLQRAWDKYGEDYFEFFAVGYYPRPELLEQEQYWLDTYTCAFNASRDASRPSHTPESIAKMRAKCAEAWQRPEHREKMASLRQFIPTRAGTKATAETRAKLQEVHRAKHRTVEAFGQLWSVKELAEAYGVKYTMLKDRLRAGWAPEMAVNQPKRKGGL
jgi:group I intron endonuclease